MVLLVPFVFLLVFFSGRKTDSRLDDFYKVANQIDAVSIGSSHTRALYFPAMGLHGYSFADDGGDIAMAELKLRLLRDYTPKLRYVFLTVSPGFLSFSHSAALPNEFPNKILTFAPFPQTLGMLSWSETASLVRANLLEIGEVALDANRLSKAVVGQVLRGGLRQTGVTANAVECEFPDNDEGHPDEYGILGGFARRPIASSCMTPEFEAADAARRIKLIRKGLANAPDTLAHNVKLMRKIAETAKSVGATLVLAVSPTTENYFRNPTLMDFWKKEYPEVQNLAASDNVVLVDIHDIFFKYDYKTNNQWFSDPNHVTLNGAKIYSKALMTALKKTDQRRAVGQRALRRAKRAEITLQSLLLRWNVGHNPKRAS